LQSSITCRGHPKRTVGSSATASGVDRSWEPRGRNCYAREVDGRNLSHSEMLRERGSRHLNAWRASTIEIVGFERPPPLAHALTQRVQVERTVVSEVLVGALGRLREEILQRERLQCRLERTQADRVHEHEPAKPVSVLWRSGPRWRRRAMPRDPV